MKILALDGSTKSTGWAIFNDANLLDYGCLISSSTDVIIRIHTMVQKLQDILKSNAGIEKIIMEEVRPEQDYSKSLKTFKALMYLQAAIAFMIHDNFPEIKIEYIYPSSWRKCCGIQTGRGIRRDALKAADITFVKNTFNLDVNDDIADAIGIGFSQTNVLNWE